MKKFTIISIISLIFLALIGGGMVWYAKSQKQKSVNPPLGQGRVATTTESVATSTKDWLTYRNEKHGFEVKYPKDYMLEQKPAIGEAFNSKLTSLKNSTFNISFFVVNLDMFIVNALESDQTSKFCKGSYNDHICYIYREENGIFYRYDRFVKNNKKYEFSIDLLGINKDLDPQQNINLFFQNEFNPQNKDLINTLDQIKASMVFY